MKAPVFIFALFFALSAGSPAQSNPGDNTVILDATGVRNLRIETVVAEEAVFEETVFALGRIEARPENVAAVSSRIAGRIVSLTAFPGDQIAKGAEVAKVESRQPGNPPPQISVTAPLGGMVTQLAVRLGDPIEPDRALLEITDMSEVLAVARIPEHVAGRLKAGTKATIVVPGVAKNVFRGELLRFGTAADSASGTLDAIFRLPNPEGLLRPGMRAEFSLELSRREGVVSIPRAALQGDPSKRFVFVKHFELPHAFVKTQVVTGQSNERSVEIVSGLLPADEVVVQGAYSLSFVGSGTLSLKEALDAAHGHEHAADGSELTGSNRKAPVKSHHGHDHDDDDHEESEGRTTFWMIVSGVLFVALLAMSFWKGSRRNSVPPVREEG